LLLPAKQLRERDGHAENDHGNDDNLDGVEIAGDVSDETRQRGVDGGKRGDGETHRGSLRRGAEGEKRNSADDFEHFHVIYLSVFERVAAGRSSQRRPLLPYIRRTKANPRHPTE